MGRADAFFGYWGKADPVVGGYHLAAFHSLDVAAVAQVWLERSTVLRSRFTRLLALDNDRQTLAVVARFVALHDTGKWDVRFQRKAPSAALALDPRWASLVPETYDHGSAGYHQIRDLIDDDEDGWFPRTFGECTLVFFQAVCGHHGSLPSNSIRAAASDSPHPATRTLAQADVDARLAWIGAVVDLFTPRGAVPLPGEPSLALVELLAGFCSVCDWIGSQTDWFSYRSDSCPLDDYFALTQTYAARAFNALPLLSGAPTGASFSAMFPFDAKGIQLCAEQVSVSGPGITIIEAAMGTGKTEAALALASRYLGAGLATGIYIGLPTMATANGMLSRLERAAEKMFSGAVNLRLAHGRALSNDAFEAIVGRKIHSASSTAETEAEVVCARWFLSRKRALLGQVGVGTVDQAMQSVLQLRHHFVRLFGLSTSVVILDEIHAYDAYMEVILEHLVGWLGALGTPLMLLSATLPKERRETFVQAYVEGAGWRVRSVLGNETIEHARRPDPYPLVTHVTAEGWEERTVTGTGASDVCSLTGELPIEADGANGESGEKKEVRVDLCRDDSPLEFVVRRLVEAARAGASVAWVRNTVTDAQSAWELARESFPESRLFHARFRGVDRQPIEKDVLREFGKQCSKEERSSKGRLLIATQVIEQSLDLDFDWLVSDLCPLDLLLQRVGRLHRHERSRPLGFEKAEVLVVCPSLGIRDTLGFGASGKIYDPVTLWLSDEALCRRPTLCLAEIRAMVEETYDSVERKARIASSPICPLLTAAQKKLEGEIDTRRQAARKVCVPPPTSSSGELSLLVSEDEVHAATRDGDSVTLLLIDWDGEEGQTLGGESWNVDASGPEAWRTARNLVEQTVSVPAYRWSRIERGARPKGEVACWNDWSKRANAFLAQAWMQDVVVVPMRKKDGVFSGRVEVTQGSSFDTIVQRRLRYSTTKGLWFPKEEDA